MAKKNPTFIFVSLHTDIGIMWEMNRILAFLRPLIFDIADIKAFQLGQCKAWPLKFHLVCLFIFFVSVLQQNTVLAF